MTDSSMLPPAAWYADPQDPAGLRYWDGAQWTDQTRPMVTEPTPEPAAAATPVEPIPAPAPEPTPEPTPQPVAAEPVAQAEPIAFEAVVAEAVVAEPIAFEASPLDSPTTTSAQDLYPGFAAEVAALEVVEEPEPPAAVEGPATASGDSPAVVVVPGDTCPGHRIVAAVGTAVGVAVVSQADLVGQFPAAAADPAATLARARRGVLSELAADAASMGATAVVGVAVEIRPWGDLTEFSAHGTAVVTERE